jgi:hypothetical protein
MVAQFAGADIWHTPVLSFMVCQPGGGSTAAKLKLVTMAARPEKVMIRIVTALPLN